MLLDSHFAKHWVNVYMAVEKMSFEPAVLAGSFDIHQCFVLLGPIQPIQPNNLPLVLVYLLPYQSPPERKRDGSWKMIGKPQIIR